MKSLGVAIRVDANNAIGTGHVRRCLSLANALRSTGLTVRFLMRGASEAVNQLVSARGYEVLFLCAPLAHSDPWLGADLETEIDESLEVLARMGGVDMLVVDHYRLDARWESAMRGIAHSLVVIDDLADRRHDCDLLMDTNPDAGDGRYDALVPSGAERLFGPTFALLAPTFRSTMVRRRTRDGSLANLLVSFGGVDESDATSLVLKVLGRRAWPFRVEVALPDTAPHAIEVARRCQTMRQVTYQGKLGDLAAAMQRADLAIGAGGTTTWERCALGLPVILYAVADNQDENVAVCNRLEVGISLGRVSNFDEQALLHTLDELLGAPARMARMSQSALRLVGNGFPTERTAQRLRRLLK